MGIIVMVLAALGCYGMPLATDASLGAASAPIWRYVVQPHIDAADASWSGHDLRLLMTAAIWCLAGSLCAAVRAVYAPARFVVHWLIGLSVLSCGLSVWILVALNHQLGAGAHVPGAVLACGTTGAAVIGTLTFAAQQAHRSS